EWRARMAPDAAPDDGDTPDGGGTAPDAGPLRIAPTVELRPYAWDFVTWIDGAPADERAEAPPPGDVLVLFWRDRALEPRREVAQPLELLVLKAVSEGHADGAGARPIVDEGAWRDTVADLHAAGILV